MTANRSCRLAAELLSRRLDEALGPADRARLGIHLFFCRSCRHVEDQLHGIRTLMSELLEGAPDGDDAPRTGHGEGRGPGAA